MTPLPTRSFFTSTEERFRLLAKMAPCSSAPRAPTCDTISRSSFNLSRALQSTQGNGRLSSQRPAILLSSSCRKLHLAELKSTTGVKLLYIMVLLLPAGTSRQSLRQGL